MSGTAGLNVDDVISVQSILTPTATPTRNFGALLMIGTSDVIDVKQRVRVYSSLDEVAADFGSTAEEYLAASLFFSQNPQPAILYIGRWASVGSHGLLYGGALSVSQQLISNFTPITTGSFHLVIDGVAHDVTGMDFSGQTTLNGVAGVIHTALVAAGFTVAAANWDPVNGRFYIESGSLGAGSTVSFGTAAGSGADITALLKLTSATGASVVDGVAIETRLQGIQACRAVNNQWYGVEIVHADDTSISGVLADYEAVSGYIEGTSPAHIVGITTQDPNVLVSGSTTDIAYVMKSLKYNRTFIQYSSTSPYAAASMYGRNFAINFDEQNSTITDKFKQEPGVIAETLTESQAAALRAKNCNVFVNYENDTAIIQEGVMASGQFFDTVHGVDWLQNNIQTRLFNRLYTTPTKISLTDPGVNILLADTEAACSDAVNNGLLAPGVWDSNYTFGSLQFGQMLTKGYYVYAPPVATQSQANRAARKCPPIQVAVKLAGAIHFVSETTVVLP